MIETIKLEKFIPLIKKSHKEIKDVKLQKVFSGKYIEVTFKNSEYRDEVVTLMKKNISNKLEYDYDGTSLLISTKML